MPPTTKRQRNKRRKIAKEAGWRKNPIEKIEFTDIKWSDIEQYVKDFVIKILTGFIWEAKHNVMFHAEHGELPEMERILHELVWLNKKEFFMPTEDEQLQLALIDFIRI